MYDLVIIGSGSGGTAAAKLAASMGARVALIERSSEKLGGACMHVNDIPSKTLVYAARNALSWKDVKRGIQESQQIISKNKTSESTYRDDGIHFHFCEATVISPRAVKVGKETVAGRRLVIASGAIPHVPSVPGLKKAGFLTLSTLIDLSRLPRSLTIIGGGVVAVEVAFALQHLGCKITIVENNSHILSRLDTDVSEYVKKRLVKAGVTIYTSTTLVNVSKANGRYRFEARHLGDPLVIRSSDVLIAAGQDAALPRGLNKIDMHASRKGIIVNSNGQTSDKRMYAIGDVVESMSHQTPGASAAASQAVKHALLGMKSKDILQPQIVFSEPEVASVGATVASLMKDEVEHQVYTLSLNEVDYGLAAKKDGFIKIICEPGGKVTGGTIVGNGAGDVIGYVAVAVNEGWSLSRLGTLPVAYPTLAAGLAQIAKEAGYHGAPVGVKKLLPLLRPIRR